MKRALFCCTPYIVVTSAVVAPLTVWILNAFSTMEGLQRFLLVFAATFLGNLTVVYFRHRKPPVDR